MALGKKKRGKAQKNSTVQLFVLCEYPPTFYIIRDNDLFRWVTAETDDPPPYVDEEDYDEYAGDDDDDEPESARLDYFREVICEENEKLCFLNTESVGVLTRWLRKYKYYIDKEYHFQPR